MCGRGGAGYPGKNTGSQIVKLLVCQAARRFRFDSKDEKGLSRGLVAVE